MENIEENTVEETQEDNNAIKQMRERIKELEGVEKEFKSVQQDKVIQEAGFDPSSGQGKALKDLYKGDLEVDAIKAFAAEQYGWGEEAPAVQEQEAQKARVVTSQDSLDAVAQASVPVEPANVNDQIAQAQQDGDWQTSSALKAEKLKALMEKKL
tara:strand:+ start:160 stop:624 length:465 start_codon:yes stop_codon:yes gene_type:complete